MAYQCNLDAGQEIIIDNLGEQTAISLISSGQGQQQSQRTSFTTGTWTSPPILFRTATGFVLQLTTSQGSKFVTIQGSSMGLMSTPPALTEAEALPMQPAEASIQPMKSMEPMQPMEPMKMGNMEMKMKPMEMRMGEMQMSMGKSAARDAGQRFCSQCGTGVGLSDRFCTKCGQRLV